MSVFDENQCIFVHIPKCAGVSITRSLFDNLAGGHTSAMDYQLIYTMSEFKRFFKFTFVRNPWDRLYSAYNFLKQGGMNEADKQWAENHLKSFDGFEHFVMDWVTEENIYSYMHFIPQYRYVCNAYGKVLVDFVGRFENIEEDFLKISKQIGSTAVLTHNNKVSVNKQEYRKKYTEKMKKIVEEVYEKDIHLFEYAF